MFRTVQAKQLRVANFATTLSHPSSWVAQDHKLLAETVGAVYGEGHSESIIESLGLSLPTDRAERQRQRSRNGKCCS